MDTTDSDRLFIITGGPGSGKSTVIDALAKRDISTMSEAGRAIIQDQVAIGGDGLAMGDRARFRRADARVGSAIVSGGTALNGPR